MKTKLKITLLFLFICTIFCNCSTFSGKKIEKTFDIDNSYTELIVKDAIEVIISNEQDQISVITTENLINDVIIEKTDNRLRLYLKKNIRIYRSDLKIILPYNPNLQKIELSGASNFQSELTLKNEEIDINISGASDFQCDIEAKEIEIELSGASDIKGNLIAQNLDIELSGASDATLSGETNTLSIELSGASNMVKKIIDNRYSLICNQCECDLSGASDAYIHCNDNINIINLAGASNLHYTGNAKITLNDSDNISGSSDIIHDTL